MLDAMQRQLLVVLVALQSGIAATAQTTRFRDPVFATVLSTPNLTYGSATNRSTNTIETLRLDLHEPTGDTATRRPVVVLVHGGGFYSGDKADSGIRNPVTKLFRRD